MAWCTAQGFERRNRSWTRMPPKNWQNSRRRGAPSQPPPVRPRHHRRTKWQQGCRDHSRIAHIEGGHLCANAAELPPTPCLLPCLLPPRPPPAESGHSAPEGTSRATPHVTERAGRRRRQQDRPPEASTGRRGAGLPQTSQHQSPRRAEPTTTTTDHAGHKPPERSTAPEPRPCGAQTTTASPRWGTGRS